MSRPSPDQSGADVLALTLRVNGVERRVSAPAHHTLLEVLRDQLKLRSVREGCGVGVCGACTVLMDGRPRSACLTLAAMAEGRDIVTVEGLGESIWLAEMAAPVEASADPGLPAIRAVSPAKGVRSLDPIQEAFIAHTGFQCSYCTPGFILTAKALIAERPEASDVEICEYLAGNLCRCGSYVKVLDSVRAAIARLRG